MKKEVLTIGNTDIEITFKPIKNLHLSVHPPKGRVTISSPEFYDLDKVKIYAATKWAWIKKEQQKFIDQQREEPRLFITQESHYFFGKRYLLKVLPAKRNYVDKKANKLYLYVKDVEDFDLKRRVLYRFYKKELNLQIQKYVTVYLKEMNVEMPEFHIRVMKTKWGSCGSNNNRLFFNIELAKKPLDCIEYIVVHEMVHLLERNHNKNFIILMNKYLPNWRVQKKILNELPI
jgi:predicted metal-dependent hydrolase